ncbi:MAG: HEAT repeat domain-containing protein [Verrucomicrobiales bacterium]|nr:HEAT repeat domain-containing protein [Verrucomicrobiales bacterium]
MTTHSLPRWCWLSTWLVLVTGLTDAVRAQPIPSDPPAHVLYHDFDRDGLKEELVSRPGTNVIRHWNAELKAWEKADFTLPEGVSLVDEAGRDTGLRFVDLNDDRFDDVLLSNPQRFAIHLWNKTVRPDLGWVRGWSQFVRAGERRGEKTEPPSLVGAEVRVKDGQLVVTRSAQVERCSAKELIAFDMPPPKSPEESLTSFRVRPGFRVELVAAEPMVIDPVSFDWGADGRFWVVEMRDYPLGLDGRGQPGGVIKVLENLNGDGRYEKVTTFLEGIAFPSSVMAWKKGVLVAAAPNLFYAEDTNGDGRADLRNVLFTGFVEGNQQHRFNGFEWGLDGWIYAANGDSGGNVRSEVTGKVLSIRGRDFRFRPDTGEFETVSAMTQFGRRRDDWGNWFGNNNPTWLWHVTLPEHYLRRNPKLAVKSVVHVLANYDDSTRVFPASPPMVRPNQPQSLNHVTSGCSPCPYRDDLFGPDFLTTVFACEPVHNAVHREVLVREGSGFASHRAAGEEHSEFLASTDNWFRPVTARTGPDGALYIADMYRFVLEHPEWISPEMLARLDVGAGRSQGRIYRVVPEGKTRRPIPNLARMSSGELVAAMDSPNGWQRDMAQRLLVERADPSVIPQVRRLLAPTHAPQVRIQAVATLGLLHALPEEVLVATLDDPHPAVRSEALRQSESLAGTSEVLFSTVSRLAEDGDAAVRLQAAFTLGAWPPDQAETVLRILAAREDTDELIRTAILSSLRPEIGLFRDLTAKTPLTKRAVTVALKPSSPDRAKVIAEYAEVANLVGNAERGLNHFRNLCAPCHRLRGEGHEVGPDLGMVASKPLDWMLTAILDPGLAVDPRYRGWTVTGKSGDEWSGLISAETANNLVVRMAGGIDQAILRDDIASMEPMKQSLMPSGFESALQLQDMADLLRWVQSH